MKGTSAVVRARLRRWLAGEDMFVSYSRRDGIILANELATRLSKAGYVVYFDQLEAWPGREIPARIRRRIQRCSMLVVVATEGAAASINVADEIRTYRETNAGRARSIGVVVAGPQIESAVWFSEVEGLPLIEDPESMRLGRISSDAFERLVRSVNFVRLRRRQTRLGLASLGVLLVIALAVAGALWRARQQLTLATDRTVVETKKAEIAESDAARAKQDSVQATASAEAARERLANGQAELRRTLLDLGQARGEASEQRSKSKSQRLASLSQDRTERDPELAMLLGIAALEAASTPEAVAAMRRALNEFVPHRDVPEPDACMSGDGGGFYALNKKAGSVSSWSASLAGQRELLAGESIVHLQCNPKGAGAVAYGADNDVWLLGRDQATKLAELSNGERLVDSGYAASGDAVSVLTDRRLAVWDLRVRPPRVWSRTTFLSSVTLLSASKVAAINSDRQLQLFDLTNDQRVTTLGRTEAQLTGKFNDRFFFTSDGRIWGDDGPINVLPEGATFVGWNRPAIATIDDRGTCAIQSLSTSNTPVWQYSWKCTGCGSAEEKPDGIGAFPGAEDETAVLTTSNCGARVWDPKTGVELARFASGSVNLEPVRSTRYVITRPSFFASPMQTTSQVWDVFPDGMTVSAKLPDVPIADNQALFDGDVWLSTDGTKAVAVLKATGDLERWSLDPTVNGFVSKRRTVPLDPHGDLIPTDGGVSVSKDGGFIALNLRGDDLVITPDDRVLRVGDDDLGCNPLAVDEKGRLARFNEHDGSITIWDTPEKPWLIATGETGHVSLSFSPDGGTLAVQGISGSVLVDLHRSRQLMRAGGEIGTTLTEEVNARTINARSLHFNREGDLLAAVVGDGPLVVWKRTGQTWTDAAVVRQLPIPNCCFSLRWRSDSRYLATVDFDTRALSTWDVDLGTLVWTIRGDTWPLAGAFFGNGAQVVSIWQRAIRFDQCRGCASPEQLLTKARAKVTRQLTAQERAAFDLD